MNIYDISNKAGVSIATVSRVLNGSGKVSESTRQKILAIIEETGYTPNAFARGLGLDTMNTIGILCADSSDPFLAAAIFHLEQGLRSHGYDSLLCCTGYDHNNKVKCLNLLRSKRVDAVVLLGSNFVEAEAARNQYILNAAADIPVVIVNGFLDGKNVFCSLSDDYDAVKMAAGRCLANGCKTPIYLYRSLSYSGRRKLKGFEDACLEAGFESSQIRTFCINGSVHDTKDFLAQIWCEQHFDAVLTSDDEMAIGALKFAKERKISIPSQLSVIGYNNSILGLCCEPELTTVDNQLAFNCTNAVTLLIKALNGESAPSKTMLSAKIVARGTTGAGFFGD